MIRGTLCVLFLLALLGATALLLPANAQVLTPPATLADPASRPKLTPPATPALPATPGSGFGWPTNIYGIKPADPTATNETEAALRALASAITVQYQGLKARGEIDAAARDRLAKTLGEIFDLRQQLQQREILMLEERLHGIRDQVASRGKQRDAVIADQVARILDGKTPPPATKTPPAAMGTGPARGGMPPSGLAPMAGSGGMGGFFPTPAPRAEVPSFEPIRIGLPDDLIGQLLQAKNDNERALIAQSFQIRISLLKTQLEEALTSAKRLKELARAGTVESAALDRAESRVKQLQVLLEAHEMFRQRIK